MIVIITPDGSMTNQQRCAVIQRETLETHITIQLTLDGQGQANLKTGVPFFEHMLAQVARHGLLDLDIQAQGDLHIDAHHTVEDIGITFGQALATAMGDKRGLQRYGHAYVPLDEALARAVLDLSGRPGLVLQAEFARTHIGDFDTELIAEFFQGLVNHAGMTVHLDVLRGRNAHHQAEALFKAFGRALRQALTVDPRNTDRIPSTKGSL
jgi:imidazoleglycerol-phosphate dehydratase